MYFIVLWISYVFPRFGTFCFFIVFWTKLVGELFVQNVNLEGPILIDRLTSVRKIECTLILIYLSDKVMKINKAGKPWPDPLLNVSHITRIRNHCKWGITIKDNKDRLFHFFKMTSFHNSSITAGWPLHGQ